MFCYPDCIIGCATYRPPIACLAKIAAAVVRLIYRNTWHSLVQGDAGEFVWWYPCWHRLHVVPVTPSLHWHCPVVWLQVFDREPIGWHSHSTTRTEIINQPSFTLQHCVNIRPTWKEYRDERKYISGRITGLGINKRESRFNENVVVFCYSFCWALNSEWHHSIAGQWPRVQCRAYNM